jgi:hypothetical protein
MSLPITLGVVVVGFVGLWLTGFWLIVLVLSVLGQMDWLRLLAAFLEGGCVGLAISVALMLLAVWLMPVSVSPEGIRCPNGWGVYRTVVWVEVTAVKPFNLLGLRYLRVFSPKLRWPLWVPRFLADQDRFERLVLAYAGPDHLLSKAIAGHARRNWVPPSTAGSPTGSQLPSRGATKGPATN